MTTPEEDWNEAEAEERERRALDERVARAAAAPKRTAIYAPKQLDALGRCCGKKPHTYKRPAYRLHCFRCSRIYNGTTKQQVGDGEGGWVAQPDGTIGKRFYDPADRENQHLGEPLAIIDEPAS